MGTLQASLCSSAYTFRADPDTRHGIPCVCTDVITWCKSGAGSPATGRLAELLQKLSPPAAADVLASMLTRDTAFKQLVLEAVDHNERMRLVVGLLQQVCSHPHHMHHAIQLIYSSVQS